MNNSNDSQSRDDENASLSVALLDTPVEESNNSNSILYEEEYSPSWFPLTFLLMPLFWKYHVRVTGNDLSFGYNYGLVAVSFERALIRSSEPVDIKPLRQWGGWGIRLQFGPTKIGYIVQSGPGVQINLTTKKGEDKTYVFSCKDPERVCALLNG